MTQIDFSKAITAQEKVAEKAIERATAIKAECTARIVDVLDANTVMNLQGAALVGALSDAQIAVFASGQAWVRAMQQACRDAIVSGADPVWPNLPNGVEELAAEY